MPVSVSVRKSHSTRFIDEALRHGHFPWATENFP